MIVGSTQLVNRNIVRTYNFTVSTSTSILTLPDNTSITPSVTVAPTTSTTQVQVGALVPFNIGGSYSLKFTITLNSGEVLLLLNDFFASITSINTTIRHRLQIDNSIISDDVIDKAVKSTATILLNRYNKYVASYRLIPPQDFYNFDMAIALITASYLRPFVPKTTPVGDMIGNTIGVDEFRYADINAHARRPLAPIEQQWIAEAQTLLDDMSFVQNDINNDNNTQLFVACGPRRNARTSLSKPDATTADYDLWGDVLTRYQWSRSFAGEI